jgi:hypothetical protein
MAGLRRVAVGCAVMASFALFASSAAAQAEVGIVSANPSERGSTIEVGETLKFSLKPADSGSTGFHWRVAKRPRGSVAILSSNRTVGNRQVLTYRARGAGVTSLKLQYVSPGRDRRVKRTFRHTVVVNRPVRQQSCDAVSPSSLLAQSATARVFKVRRAIRVFAPGARGNVVRHSYDVFLGCADGGQTQQLGAFGFEGPEAGANEVYNVTLRGAVVAYVFVPGCPFEIIEETGHCTAEAGPPVVAAQDLKAGTPIRASYVDSYAADAYYTVAGLVVSPAGGLAWIETVNGRSLVRRSDGPAAPGVAFSDQNEVLDEGDDINPDSLYFDGSDLQWLKAGKKQRAPLR